MTDHVGATPETVGMRRPRILVRTARMGARQYRRRRDLPGAVPGLLARPAGEIVQRLVEAEARCEDDRRHRSPGYRPARHVQILAALLAERRAVQAKASGSAALRPAT